MSESGEKLEQYIAETIKEKARTKNIEDDVNALDNLFSARVLDSLDILTLLSGAEAVLGCEIDLSEADPLQFRTVKGIAEAFLNGAEVSE